MTPEAKARQCIDKKLQDAGYVIQDMQEFNPSLALGVVVREFPTKSGPIDYLIFIDREPVGVIEAKQSNSAENITTVELQSKKYAESELIFSKATHKIRFAYEATDIITRFTDYNDIKFRSRSVFTFHKPETLQKWLASENTLRNMLKKFPEFNTENFRICQSNAILNLEQSFAQNRPRALIQMATGAGKTFTAITASYRLLKFAKARRILFLVDTKNLGEQAEEEFRKYKPNDDARLFPELYNVCRLNSSFMPENSHVCISTIQRMYSILCNKDMDESLEENSMNEQAITGDPKEVQFNTKYPPEFFDFIIIDECHRSIYNVWQQVLDYFDAFLIGLTATPDKRTFAFFNENIVSEYSHELAVIDGVNVGRDGTYIIETEISKKGASILKQTIEKRNRLSRKKRWEQADEDINYTPSQLDRDVVNPSQIRNIIRAFKNAAFTTLFPQRKELPKTLIFAKTDSHADDIIKIVREEFNEGNEFCQKITYSVDDPKSVLTSFRNDFYPRIAVTVDMIATGTDVKPIECLVFMRDVRSKNYFEQMLGRATRTLNKADLEKVSPSATEKKLGYILVDAVGVTKSQKSTSRQLERKPTESLKQLLMAVALNARDEDTLTSLASRLLKLENVLTAKEKEACEKIQHISLNAIAQNLLNAFDEDFIHDMLMGTLGATSATEGQGFTGNMVQNFSPEEYAKAQNELIDKAVNPIYDNNLRDFILNARKAHDQIIDNINIDKVNIADWDSEYENKVDETIQSFRDFIDANKDSITALNIIYNQDYKNRYITLKMVEELHDALAKHQLSNPKLWKAYEIKFAHKVQKGVEHKLCDIVSLIRFELKQANELTSFSTDVNNRFQKWIFKENSGYGQFTEEQTKWLRMIRDHIATSIHIDKDDFDYSPFNSKGGLGKFYALFGDAYQQLLDDINFALVA